MWIFHSVVENHWCKFHHIAVTKNKLGHCSVHICVVQCGLLFFFFVFFNCADQHVNFFLHILMQAVIVLLNSWFCKILLGMCLSRCMKCTLLTGLCKIVFNPNLWLWGFLCDIFYEYIYMWHDFSSWVWLSYSSSYACGCDIILEMFFCFTVLFCVQCCV